MPPHRRVAHPLGYNIQAARRDHNRNATGQPVTDLKLCLFGASGLECLGRTRRVSRRKALALAGFLALAEQSQSREAVANPPPHEYVVQTR